MLCNTEINAYKTPPLLRPLPREQEDEKHDPAEPGGIIYA